MTDRELLELAARACGFGAENTPGNPRCWTESEYPRDSGKHGALWNYVGHGSTAELWNPLTDDGDALRLAVNLQLIVGHDVDDKLAYAQLRNPHRSFNEFYGGTSLDPHTATRRAIVRAAAAIAQEPTNAQA